jgi:hypothetical protein
MAKYKIFGTTSKELTLPTTKPETSLDFVNSQCIDPSYTFTRNSSGTYVGDDGLIKTAAVNEPRFEFDVVTGEFKGLLIEEARTNRVNNSETFTGRVLRNSNLLTVSTIAPDGTTSVKKLSDNTSVSRFRELDYTENQITGTGNFTFSIFVKKAEREILGMGNYASNPSYWLFFNLTTESFFTVSGFDSPTTYGYIKYPNDWYRIWYTVVIISNSGLRLDVITGIDEAFTSYTGDGTSGVYVWGQQAEAGTFPSSYIPTVGSTVTRQPDQLVLNRTLNPQGAFYIESNNTLGTSLVADNGTSTISPPQGTKSALYYNTSRTLSMSSSTQPVEGNYNIPQNLNRVSLGFDRLNNSNYINGHLKKFMYYGSPVTEDNLRSLTGNTRSTFRFDREQIITDGLVLNLDAGNPASYPGSGTTWFDLSGFGNNGTLVNGVGYNSGNGGSLVFDGVDDYVSNSINLGSSNFDYTIIINFSINSFNGDMRLGGAYSGGTGQLTFGWDNTIFRLWLQSTWNNTNFTFSSNTNYNISIVHLSTTTYLYINGLLNTTILNKTSFFSNIGLGNSFILQFGNYFNGKIYTSSIYNRALTASEIAQNFNALRSRYGI